MDYRYGSHQYCTEHGQVGICSECFKRSANNFKIDSAINESQTRFQNNISDENDFRLINMISYLYSNFNTIEHRINFLKSHNVYISNDFIEI